MSGSTNVAERAFVLGFDGLPWRLVRRWSEEGHLPAFGRLFEEGATGPLDSTRPATTPLAWPSIATGVWPDKHGIYGFQRLSADYSHRMYTSRDLTQPPLWRQLSPSVVGNVPMTYPAGELDGELVTGMMTPSTDSEFTYPASLGDEIADRIPDYRISLNYPDYADRRDEFEAAIEDVLTKRRDLLRLLQERRPDWRLFFFVFTAPDRFQHLIWDEDRLLDLYRTLDEILAEVMDYADDHDADLYVVSDHGFQPIDELVYTNHFLEREGFLVQRDDAGTRGALSSLGISRGAVRRALNAVGITEKHLVSALPRTLVDSVAEQIPGEHALYDIDSERTTAFVHGAGNLYVNDSARFEDGIVEPREVPAVKAEIRSALESATAPDSDERLFELWDGDDLFPTDERSPDLVVNGRNGYETRASLSPEPTGDTGHTAASHGHTGILLCRGPSIDAGTDVRGARVVDVAPTLLHALGEPVPSNADGRVLFDAFADGSPPTETKVRRRDVTQGTAEAVDQDFSDVQRRLKGLGYME